MIQPAPSDARVSLTTGLGVTAVGAGTFCVAYCTLSVVAHCFLAHRMDAAAGPAGSVGVALKRSDWMRMIISEDQCCDEVPALLEYLKTLLRVPLAMVPTAWVRRLHTSVEHPLSRLAVRGVPFAPALPHMRYPSNADGAHTAINELVNNPRDEMMRTRGPRSKRTDCLRRCASATPSDGSLSSEGRAVGLAEGSRRTQAGQGATGSPSPEVP